MKPILSSLTLFLTISIFCATVLGVSNESRCATTGGSFIWGSNRHSVHDACSESPHSSAADIIHPQTGQFANYSHSLRYANGTSWSGWWNISYNEYVQPHIINTTHVIVRPEFDNGTFWCTVDTTNRWVTNTDSKFWWNRTWYVPWIETNVTVGSTIKWWISNATIVGSKILQVAGRSIDCWIANGSYVPEFSYYDKASGLLAWYQISIPNVFDVNMILNDTNIPLGQKLSTALYFNLNPNPVSAGQKLTLKGILTDEFSKPLMGEVVKLYARPLAGSWQYIRSLTTSIYGVFMWQTTIPSVKGTFIFAAYYSGSEIYETSYNIAILIIQ